MPKNFKEELVFTGLIAGMMVFGMTMYNVFKASGINMESWGNVATGFPLALLVAVILDLALVGPLAKKIVFSHIEKKELTALSCTTWNFYFLVHDSWNGYPYVYFRDYHGGYTNDRQFNPLVW